MSHSDIYLFKMLNNIGYEYKINSKSISHLFYIDDLKLYARNDPELKEVFKTEKFQRLYLHRILAR